MVRRKRGSGIEEEGIKKIISTTIEKNKTVFELLDEC